MRDTAERLGELNEKKNELAAEAKSLKTRKRRLRSR